MKVKLYPDKTDFIIIGDKKTESLIPTFPVTFRQSSIMSTEEVKHLGVQKKLLTII